MPSLPKQNILFWLNMAILVAVLTHSIYRDIQLEKQYPSDLRNRIVGARLQKDGQPPYFYKWKKEDGYRYIDPANFDSLKVSNITASPVLHNLLMPVCNLPQRTISVIWLWFQYLILGTITILFIRLANNPVQKYAVINFSVLFTATEAWKSLIANGQSYFFMTLLIATTIYGLLKSNKKQYLLLAALGSALLVLLRPTAVIIYLPFLFQYKSMYKYLLTTFAFILAYGLFAIFNPTENKFWVSYNNALKEEVKLHQDLQPTLQKNEPRPLITKLEGFDFDEVNDSYARHPIGLHSENGNVFVLVRLILHKKIGVNELLILFASCILGLGAGFIYRNTKTTIPITHTILLAFLFYMLTEIFGPIYRHQYNTVQWLPLLLAALFLIKSARQPAAFLIGLGLLLNISNIPAIPLQHTMGEFCWMMALILLVFAKPATIPDTHKAPRTY